MRDVRLQTCVITKAKMIWIELHILYVTAQALNHNSLYTPESNKCGHK